MPNLRPTEGPSLPWVYCATRPSICPHDDHGDIDQAYDHVVLLVRLVALYAVAIVALYVKLRGTRISRIVAHAILGLVVLAGVIYLTVRASIILANWCGWHGDVNGHSAKYYLDWSLGFIIPTWIVYVMLLFGHIILNMHR